MPPIEECHREQTFYDICLSFCFIGLTQKLIKSVLCLYNTTISIHFFALKRQRNKYKFLSFLEYRVSLLSSFLGFGAQATRVSYKPVSYKKNVYKADFDTF